MRTQEKKLPQALSRWNIPSTWKWVSIADIGSVITGNTPPTKDAMNYGNDIPFVKPSELFDKGIWAAPGGLSQKGIKTARTLPVGATLVSCIGGLGKTGIAKVPIAFNQQINAIVFNDIVIPEYGFYYTQTLKGWLYGVASATTLPIVNKGKFQKAPFPLASPNEQKLIVSEIEKQFSRLDEATTALKRIKANLKRYKASVLKAAVEGKLTEEWRNRKGERPFAHEKEETGADLLKRILAERRRKWEEEYIKKYIGAHGHAPKDDNWKKKYKEPAQTYTTNLPELAKGWVLANIGQISASMKNGLYKPHSAYKDNGIACLRMYNIEDGNIVWKDIKRMLLSKEEIEEYQLLPGDLLVNRVNSRELVGKTAPIPKGLETCVFESKNIRVRVPTDLVNTKFVSYIFFVNGQTFFNRNAQQVVGMASISQPQVSALPVPLPTISEQNQIVDEVENRLSVIHAVDKEVTTNLKRSERLRQSILKKAFSGKLVPQDPNDKPVSELMNKKVVGGLTITGGCNE
jgi:type I restriction enzyme, S subunit